jgi:hypothetical protein
MAQRHAALILALLILTPALAADDNTVLRAYCLNLLNITEQNYTAENLSAARQLPNASNFTFSDQYYDAAALLTDANKSVERMRAAGFPYMQSRDLYLLGEQWLIGQAALELSGEKADYRFIGEKSDEVAAIEKSAFSVSDELAALDVRFSKIAPDVNTSEASQLQEQAEKEFSDGRFEEAARLINSAYDKIAQAEAEATRSRALLESTRRTLQVFLEENWQNILALLVALGIFFFLFQKQIRRFLINAKIAALTAERGVLENMIKSLQKEYFESGKVNELTYHIKTKKFGDLIRNINRQLPLLREELKKL